MFNRRSEFLRKLRESVFIPNEFYSSPIPIPSCSSEGKKDEETEVPTLETLKNVDPCLVYGDLNLSDDSDADPTVDLENLESASSSDEEIEGKTKTKRLAAKHKKLESVLNREEGQTKQLGCYMELSTENAATVSATVDTNQNKRKLSRKERIQNKSLRNAGKSYISSSKKLVEARSMGPLKMCRMKCKEKFSDENRSIIFDNYWKLGSRDSRANFVASCIKIEPKKSQSTNASRNREVSCKYMFNIENIEIPVCKSCLTSTLGETRAFIEIVMSHKKKSPLGIGFSDQRGIAPPKNKITESQIEKIKEHINSFPRYESHYCRKSTQKQYLSGDLSISKMYSLYKETDCSPVSMSVYLRVFHELNLAFKPPKKDTCHKCDLFEMKIKSCTDLAVKNDFIKERDDHQNFAQNAYDAKKFDKAQCVNDTSKMVFTFDLQQCLPTPYLTNSISFYKRQLWSFNLTAHNLSNNNAICFLWDETISGRGSNQIASCIYRLLKNLVPPGVKEITFYSDTCGGQNKNFNVALMFLHAIKHLPNIERINHKFLVSGHTHMECDSDHAVIEREKKKTSLKINHLNDWIQLIRGCKKKNPFVVQQMEAKDFFDFGALRNKNGPFQIKKKYKNGDKFLWRDVQWVQYRKNSPSEVFIKFDLEEETEFQCMSFQRRKKPHNIDLPLVSETPLGISAAKKKDLIDLLPFIDSAFHDFYLNLKVNHEDSGVINEDPDLNEFDPDNMDQ